MTVREPSPIVDALALANEWLRENTFHKILSRRFRRLESDASIEYWVVGWGLIAAVVFIFAPYGPGLTTVLLVAAALRLEEILVNVSYVTLFHGRFNTKPLAGRRRIVILLLINYVEIVAWAAFFFLSLGLGANVPLFDSRVLALAFSFSSASGIGNPPVAASSTSMLLVSLCESSVGLFMLIAVLARFVAFLPRLRAGYDQDDDDD